IDKYNLLQRIKKLFKGMYIKILFKRSHLKFKIAKEKENLELVCHLRWRTYGQELKYINPNDYPDQKYSDKYDKYSVNFLALTRNKAVGTLRLIFHSPLGFYIERDFPIVQPPIKPEEIAELSQFTILKEYRGGKRLISFGLLKKAFEFSKQKGITHWYALMGEKIKINSMILPIEIIIVILITIGNLTLGMIVYLKNHTSNINRSFLGFSLFLTFWIFGAFLSELVKDLYASLILSRVVYASVILAAISLFYFSIFFSKEKLNIIVNFICLGISGVVIYIILFTKLIIAEAIISSWGFDLVSGRFYFIFTSWVLILTILSVYKFFFLYRKSDNYQKQQLLYFLLGFGIFIFANVFFNIFVRQLTGNDIYYRFGNYSSIFLVGLVAYAIIKRELFGIKVILTELLVGLVAIVLLVELC